MSKRLAFVFVALAVLACRESEGGPAHPKRDYDSGGSAVVFKGGALPYTRPKPVEESDRVRTCPKGFSWQGSECVKQIVLPPDIRCPSGFNYDDDKNECVKLLSKFLQCPAGYVRHEGLCLQNHEVEADIVCPGDFAFGPDGRQCVRAVELERTSYCPSDSTRKGDICVRQIPVPWEITCPPDFELREGRCYLEETFDCSGDKDEEPPRHHYLVPPPGSDDVKKVAYGDDDHYSRQRHHHHKPSSSLRALAPLVKHGGPFGLPSGDDQYLPLSSDLRVPSHHGGYYEERVIGTTCKRTRFENTIKICPFGARLTNKSCVKDEIVPLMIKPGGFREEFAPPLRQCPRGYTPGALGRCFAQTEVVPELVCPIHTKNIGTKCAVFRAPLLVCPPEFKLEEENDICSKSITAPPLIEFTVTYACTGKDCAD